MRIGWSDKGIELYSGVRSDLVRARTSDNGILNRIGTTSIRPSVSTDTAVHSLSQRTHRGRPSVPSSAVLSSQSLFPYYPVPFSLVCSCPCCSSSCCSSSCCSTASPRPELRTLCYVQDLSSSLSPPQPHASLSDRPLCLISSSPRYQKYSWIHLIEMSTVSLYYVPV